MNYEHCLQKYEIQSPQLFLKKSRKQLYLGLYQNKSVFIKIVTDVEGVQREVDALRYLKKIIPHNIPEIFLHENNVVIMERIFPGTTLKKIYALDDMKAMEVVCKSIEHLHVPFLSQSKHHFQTLDYLVVDLKNECKGIPQEYRLLAYKIAQSLLQTTEQQVLLHGDLFHDNILYSDKNEWVVIDPKGVIGDPVYEVASALFSPLSELVQHKECKKIIEERIVFIANRLQYFEDRIQKWLFVKSVLAWIWALEDNEPQEWVNYFATIAQMFKPE